MAFSIVTHAAAQGVGSTTTATTPAKDTTGADSIYLGVVGFINMTTATVSDNKGNTWTAIANAGTGSNVQGAIWYCKNPTVGSGHTFSVSGSYSPIFMIAVSGSLTTGGADKHSENGSAATTSIQAGSITPSQDNEICIALLGQSASSVPSINSSYNITDTIAALTNNSAGGSFAYLIQTTAGATNPTWSDALSIQMSANIASFKVAGAVTVPYGWRTAADEPINKIEIVGS